MYGIFFYRVCLVYTCVLLFLPPVILEKQTQTFCTRAQHYDKYQLNTRAKSKLCPPLHYTFACLPLWNGLLWACSRVLITSRGVTKIETEVIQKHPGCPENAEIYRYLIINFYNLLFFVVSREGKKEPNSFYNVIRQREKDVSRQYYIETKENYIPCMVCKTSNLSFLIY